MTYTITNKQMGLFRRAAFENYITALAEHCYASAPYLKLRIAEEPLRQILKQQVARIEARNFTQQGTTTFLIDMMLAYGYHCFDDPQYPWIEQTLAEHERHYDEVDRVMPLYHAMTAFAQKADGPDQEYLLKVLSELKKLQDAPLNIGRGHYVEEMLPLLKKIHPGKTQASDEDAIAKLVACSVEKGEKTYGFYSSQQIIPITLSMFLFGHQFDTDPFRPFIDMDELKGPYALAATIGNMEVFLTSEEK